MNKGTDRVKKADKKASLKNYILIKILLEYFVMTIQKQLLGVQSHQEKVTENYQATFR